MQKSFEKERKTFTYIKLLFLILFHTADSMRLSARLAPTGEILVHEGMETGAVTGFQEVA